MPPRHTRKMPMPIGEPQPRTKKASSIVVYYITNNYCTMLVIRPQKLTSHKNQDEQTNKRSDKNQW